MYSGWRNNRWSWGGSYYRPGYPRPYYYNSWWNWPDRFIVNDDDSEDETPTTPSAPAVPEEKPEEKPIVEENVTKITDYKVDYMKKRNGFDHNTHRYGGGLMVIRRGQEFRLKIEVNSFDEGKDKLKIQFINGINPQASKGTLIDIPICNNLDEAKKSWVYRKDGWYGYFDKVEQTELEIVLFSSGQAPIGQYQIRTEFVDQQKKSKYERILKKGPEPIYIIFNAWCKDDQVYMEDDKERNEYVMNEYGAIWRGRYDRNGPKAWDFGQFSRTSLKAAFHLLEKSGIAPQKCNDAITVCRKLSSMANSCDDYEGVLVGNWSGDYEGGTKPTAWNGSVAILEEYMSNVAANKMVKHVNFGQCWVFSGLLTTLSRTLGIPTRSVTNFASAHDTDKSLSIDYHFDENGDPIDGLNADSVWNFHVWNEAWMKRPDLPAGYEGWQAFDSTPQEESEKIYQCGPGPVKAIKDGHIHMSYDLPFIFSEVNGDKVHWSRNKDGTMEFGKVLKHAVGKVISTKAVGSELREDVTEHYKYSEGSDEERAAVQLATSYMAISSEKANVLLHAYNEQERDVIFDYKFEKPPNGDISVKVFLKNNANEKRTVRIKFTANASYYTGTLGKKVGEKRMNVVLQPGEEKDDITWEYKAHNYLDNIDEDADLTIHVYAKVLETGQWDGDSETSKIEKPDLQMEASNNTPKVGEEFTVTIKMENPVEVKLTKCTFHVEGAGIQKRKKIDLDDVEPNQGAVHTVTLTAKYPGERSVIACFNSRQIQDITGRVFINVQE